MSFKEISPIPKKEYGKSDSKIPFLKRRYTVKKFTLWLTLSSLLMCQLIFGQKMNPTKSKPNDKNTLQREAVSQKNQEKMTKIFPKPLSRLTGKVIKKAIDKDQKSDSGYVILMQTNKGIEMVDLAPEWYLKNYNLTIRENDQLLLNGWSEEIQGNQIFLAIDIDLGNGKVNLRNAWGKPLWHGQLKKKL